MSELSKYYQSPKLLRLSYSSEGTFKSCPRKWLLSRLKKMEKDNTVDTEFGKAFGEGCQAILSGKDIMSAIWSAFVAFEGDFDELGDYTKRKDFWRVVDALKRFEIVWLAVYSHRYQLVWLHDMPACELGFEIKFPDGTSYIGFLDAVLYDTETKELVVLETKTTAYSDVHEAKYGNSAQGTGYGVVLDSIAKRLQEEGIEVSGSSYTVLYFIYLTKSQEFKPMPLMKTAVKRANWLRDRMMSISVINFYKQQEYFPQDGDSCLAFNRPCPFYGMCDMDISYLVSDGELGINIAPPRDEIKFVFTFDELVARQQELNENLIVEEL